MTLLLHYNLFEMTCTFFHQWERCCKTAVPLFTSPLKLWNVT